MFHPTPAQMREGVDEELIRSVRDRLEAVVLAKSEELFARGTGPDDLRRPELKPLERVVNFYDYQACCISPLARAVAAGNERARAPIANILANARTYLDDIRPHLPQPLPLRRLLLHIARAYCFLKRELTPGERRQWGRLATRIADDVIEKNGRFRPGLRELHNATLGTGTNHVALCGEALFFAGRVFDRPDWCALASDLVDRLVRFCHPDGYFEENTNAEREGGPSLSYTNLTYGAAFCVCWANGTLADHALVFRRCAAFSRSFLDARLENLTFADERTNRFELRVFGAAAHSLSPEGRGYLRLRLGDEPPAPIEQSSLQMLARLDHELDAMQTGPGEAAEPWREGDTRLSLPLAVRRRGDWTCGLSALRALNRQLRPDSDYALDRQGLLTLVHRHVGRILSGFKSKRDPDWSTLRVGDDAWPVQTGALRATDTELVATVHYRTFTAEVGWRLSQQAVLFFRSTHPRQVLAQLPVELGLGDKLRINHERAIILGREPAEAPGVWMISCRGWSARADRAGTLRWPIAPHDPYNQGSQASRQDQRALWVLPWEGACRVQFAVNQKS